MAGRSHTQLISSYIMLHTLHTILYCFQITYLFPWQQDGLKSDRLYYQPIVGTSLSKPHTSVTALRMCVYARLLAAIYRKF